MTELLDKSHAFAGASLMRRSEIDAVIRLCPLNGMALEIGTYDGATAAIIAKARPDIIITSVDPFIDHDDKDFRTRSGCERLKNWRVNRQSNQRLWVGDLESFHSVCGRVYDFILVDGAHHFAAVLDDLRRAAVLTSAIAIIAVHDYAGPEWPEVTQATDAFMTKTAWRPTETVESLLLLRETGE